MNSSLLTISQGRSAEAEWTDVAALQQIADFPDQGVGTPQPVKVSGKHFAALQVLSTLSALRTRSLSPLAIFVFVNPHQVYTVRAQLVLLKLQH